VFCWGISVYRLCTGTVHKSVWSVRKACSDTVTFYGSFGGELGVGPALQGSLSWRDLRRGGPTYSVGPPSGTWKFLGRVGKGRPQIAQISQIKTKRREGRRRISRGGAEGRRREEEKFNEEGHEEHEVFTKAPAAQEREGRNIETEGRRGGEWGVDEADQSAIPKRAIASQARNLGLGGGHACIRQHGWGSVIGKFQVGRLVELVVGGCDGHRVRLLRRLGMICCVTHRLRWRLPVD